MKWFFLSIRTFIGDHKKYRKWGQICLVSAILLNGLVLAINLYLTGLQGELQNRRNEEQYFIINEQTKRTESARYTLLQGNSNQLVLLRRLTDDRLSPDERETIKSNVRNLNLQSETSKINLVAITYLLANDPLKGTDVFRMFEDKSDIELLRLQVLYEKQANEYANDLKRQMVQLMDSISMWKYAHSSMLVLSSIILILGGLLNFRSETAIAT